eukprot:8930124-Alexandrium_andersonii.AAC.1
MRDRCKLASHALLQKILPPEAANENFVEAANRYFEFCNYAVEHENQECLCMRRAGHRLLGGRGA